MRMETGPILRVCGCLIGLEIAMLFTLCRCIGIQGEHIAMKRWVFRSGAADHCKWQLRCSSCWRDLRWRGGALLAQWQSLFDSCNAVIHVVHAL
eukprot:3157030-Ditylum_brightwellii.AAC.1